LMRVLHVSAGNLFGGVEVHLSTLARHSSAVRELEQRFAVVFAGRLSEELRKAGHAPHLIDGVRIRNPASVLSGRRRLRAVLEREEIEVAVCHSAWSLAMFGPAVVAAGVPLVLWQHDVADASHWLYRLARRTRPALVIANSRYTASTLPRIYPGVPVEVIHCPVEAPVAAQENGSRDAVRVELETPADAVVIVQASRLERWKGHLLHLRALNLLRDLPEWRLWIVGGVQRRSELGYRGELEARAGELGIADRVRFLGQRTDVPRVLAAADIHCQPNTGPEPFGIVFVEALYAGLPCVSTAMGGPKEILDDECGVLVPPEDPVALAAALRELVRDRERRDRLGRAGPGRARAISTPAVKLEEMRGALRALSGQEAS
jgi:glycosyltransferase involved in cell wall biosynthesis